MALPESMMQKTGKSSVANQHYVKCVKCVSLIIGACKSQNDMGTGHGENCLSILIQFEIIHLETHIYIGTLSCSKGY